MDAPTSAASKYRQHVVNDNTAQTDYTNTLPNAYRTKMNGNAALGITGINKAKQNYATRLANAAGDRDQALARYDEILSMLTPSKAYLDNVAKAEGDKAVQLAEAAYHRTVSENNGNGDGTYELLINAAQSAYETTLNEQQQIYGQASSEVVSTWYVSWAMSEHDTAAAWISAEVVRASANTVAQSYYSHVSSGWLVTIADTRD